MKRLFLFLLLMPLLQGQVTYQGVTLQSVSLSPVVAAGCTPVYTETTWDNLTGWTQSSENNFTADATNDELDFDASNYDYSYHLRQDANEAAGGDMCAIVKVVAIDVAGGVGFILRTPSSEASTYMVTLYDDGALEFQEATLGAAGPTSTHTLHSTTGTWPSAGDYISFCVSDTSTNTLFEWWDHGAVDPGDCRGDWGAADWSETGCGIYCVDTANVRSGLIGYANTGDDYAGTYDEFVLTDY